MQIEMKRTLYIPEVEGAKALLWTVIRRMLTPYVDLVFAPGACAKKDAVLVDDAETADELLLSLGAALTRCAALDDQPELADLADGIAEAVQMALDTIENDDDFLTAVAACLAQIYSDDQVVLSNDEGDTQYEVVYRALRGEDEYAVLFPVDGEQDSLLILRCIYPDGNESPAFEDADEEIAASVYTEFMQEFADELNGEDA